MFDWFKRGRKRRVFSLFPCIVFQLSCRSATLWLHICVVPPTQSPLASSISSKGFSLETVNPRLDALFPLPLFALTRSSHLITSAFGTQSLIASQCAPSLFQATLCFCHGAFSLVACSTLSALWIAICIFLHPLYTFLQRTSALTHIEEWLWSFFVHNGTREKKTIFTSSWKDTVAFVPRFHSPSE